MQVIDKPKQYRLPIRLNPVSPDKSGSRLPNIYLGSKLSKKSRQPNSSRDLTIRYEDLDRSRGVIRIALSKNMNFEHIEGCQHSVLSQKLLEQLPETITTLGYSTSSFQQVLRVVREIFGEDFSLSNKDIIVARGKISQNFYIFFTSAYYRPQSFCCQAMIYLKLQSLPDNIEDIYKAKKTGMEETASHSTFFLCSKCKKTVLKINKQGKLRSERSRIKESSSAHENDHFEKQRKKIMMSIMVASGRYKKNRISDVSSLIPNKDLSKILPLVTIPLKKDRSKNHLQRSFDI